MIRRYLDLVKEALHAVEDDYYRVPTICNAEGAARERVFCYELYHQMRSKGVVEEGIVLHGELDKSNHRDFHQEKPDFLFHRTQTHECNTLVIEVKGKPLYGADAIAKSDIERDLRKLLRFVNENHYQAGLFIIYNNTLSDLSEKLVVELGHLQQSEGAERVSIMAIQPTTLDPGPNRFQECCLRDLPLAVNNRV